jgi:sulfur-oxidizing protein SoxY
MMINRRRFLGSLLESLALAPAFWGLPRTAHGGGAVKPGAGEDLRAALRREVGDHEPGTTTEIMLDIPRVAEDGSVVPVTVASRIPGTDRLMLFVEKNPFPLAAAFEFGRESDAFVSLRIRMAESCDVLAIAHAGGRYYMTRRSVRVVVGGCS